MRSFLHRLDAANSWEDPLDVSGVRSSRRDVDVSTRREVLARLCIGWIVRLEHPAGGRGKLLAPCGWAACVGVPRGKGEPVVGNWCEAKSPERFTG